MILMRKITNLIIISFLFCSFSAYAQNDSYATKKNLNDLLNAPISYIGAFDAYRLRMDLEEQLKKYNLIIPMQ